MKDDGFFLVLDQYRLKLYTPTLNCVGSVLDERSVDAIRDGLDDLLTFALELGVLGAITIERGVVTSAQLVHVLRVLLAEQIAKFIVHEMRLQGREDTLLHLTHRDMHWVLTKTLVAMVGTTNAIIVDDDVATAARATAHQSSQKVFRSIVGVQGIARDHLALDIAVSSRGAILDQTACA